MNYEFLCYFLLLIVFILNLTISKLNKRIKQYQYFSKPQINPRDKEIIKYECEHCSNIIGVTYKALADTYQLHCHRCNQETKFSMPLSEEYINSRPKTTIVGFTNNDNPIYSHKCKHCDTMNLTETLNKDICFKCRKVLPVIVT